MITVLGAGSIGCYLGGMLAAHGQDVTLIARPAMMEAMRGGFTVSGMDGRTVATSPSVTTDHQALAGATTILVCVKSADTAEAATLIKTHAAKDAQIISLQNGLTNPETLAQVLGAGRVTAGMVGFNVVRDAHHFSQTTEGEIILAPSGQAFADLIAGTPIAAFTHPNMDGIQWSKLLLNLNNALNALSGLGLRAQLEGRDWRRVLAACIAEGLAVAKAENVRLERLGKVHPLLLPGLLRLPNVFFLRIAQSMLRISPTARSSMADDYVLHRASEVAWLNGHIADRAQTHNLPAPVNEKVIRAVNAAFADEQRCPLQHAATSLLA